MNTFLTSAGAVALVKSLVDLIKYVRAKNTNGYVTQLVVWAAGMLTVLLLKASDLATTIPLAGAVNLDGAKWGTVVLAGLGLGSAAMLVNDLKTAIDNTDSASKPPLVGPVPPNV